MIELPLGLPNLYFRVLASHTHSYTYEQHSDMNRLPALNVFASYKLPAPDQSSSPLSSLPADSDDLPSIPFLKTPSRHASQTVWPITPRCHEAHHEPSEADTMEAQSSPLPAKGEARRAAKMRKTKKRLSNKKRAKEQESLTAAIERITLKKEEERRERENYREVLSLMKAKGISLGDFFVEMSRPTQWKGERYRGFFSKPQDIVTVLEYWSASKKPKVRQAIETWAVSLVERLVDSEGNKATQAGILRSRDMEVNENFILNFDLPNLYSRLAKHCPSMIQILHAFATTTRQKRQATEESKAKKTKVSLQTMPREYTYNIIIAHSIVTVHSSGHA